MVMLAFLLTTVVSSRQAGYTLQYAFVFITIIFVIIFHNAMLLYFMFFKDDLKPWVNIVRKVFYLFPGFTFSKIYGQIARVTGSHFVSEAMIWEDGRVFEWKDLF